MHNFPSLADRCAEFTLSALSVANSKAIEALQGGGPSVPVQTLQMVRLQKTIFAVGMLSVFEAILQNDLNCDDGFVEARRVLDCAGEEDLKSELDRLLLAINVLKHGRGRSYEKLVAQSDSLSFRIKLPDDAFLEEGDVSEINTLIEVDDAFVQLCGNVISRVAAAVKR
ncbi:MAG: hypothetical protein KC561_09185 [Myxococcales bacterium]|nr:hypothetical protein [Myxococcales bacterium]